MSGDTVVIPGDGGESAEFAAGVATAQAAQAREDVQQLEARTEVAELEAESARETAGAAIGEAYDARAAVEGLRFEIGDMVSGLAARLEELAAARTEPPTDVVEEVPAPEPAEEPEPPAEEPKPKRRRYGSPVFFGSRAYEDD